MKKYWLSGVLVVLIVGIYYMLKPVYYMVAPDLKKVTAIVIEDASNSVKIIDKEDIEVVYRAVTTPRKTRTTGYNDTPTTKEPYTTITMLVDNKGTEEKVTYYLYKDKGSYKLEMPYNGIFKMKTKKALIILEYLTTSNV